MESRHRIGVLAELPRVLRGLGHEPDPIIAGGGIDPALLQNPEAAVPFSAMGRLLQACVDTTGCEHIGLLTGRAAPRPVSAS